MTPTSLMGAMLGSPTNPGMSLLGMIPWKTLVGDTSADTWDLDPWDFLADPWDLVAASCEAVDLVGEVRASELCLTSWKPEGRETGKGLIDALPVLEVGSGT